MDWKKLKSEIIDVGLCTQCGTCVGLSNNLVFKEKAGIPLPTKIDNSPIHNLAYQGCPARYCNYPELNKFVFGKEPQSYLSGNVEETYVGHASDEAIRRNGASGGVITQVLIHLLETKQINGAICLHLGEDLPYKAKPIIARTKDEIIKCAQSIYSVTPVNSILGELEKINGNYAYVGLPDQVASIRKLQKLGHSGAKKIKFILGPYMGTQMYFAAIRSFLRSHGVNSVKEITQLKYRAGEWPGYLEIKLKNGRVLRAEKFYYNYLIPFFITSSSLQLVDFTNELCDISVGDAWSPEFEKQKGGHSVVLARNSNALKILVEMQKKELLTLNKIELNKALDMHGHMLDFKKRGSFIRNAWKKHKPDYGYKPQKMPITRVIIEACLFCMFAIGRLEIIRWVVEHIPLKIIGPLFNVVRKSWKGLSKPTKRKNLREMKFIKT
jgi:coenzyme F420 hydrogenase subunit beta